MSEHLYSFPSRTSTSPPPDTSCSCNYVNHDYILLQNPRAPPTNVSNWYQPLQYLRLKLNFLRKGSRPRTEVRIQPSIHQNIPHWEYRHQHLITERVNIEGAIWLDCLIMLVIVRVCCWRSSKWNNVFSNIFITTCIKPYITVFFLKCQRVYWQY